jgi:hypothetical protein
LSSANVTPIDKEAKKVLKKIFVKKLLPKTTLTSKEIFTRKIQQHTLGIVCDYFSVRAQMTAKVAIRKKNKISHEETML